MDFAMVKESQALQALVFSVNLTFLSSPGLLMKVRQGFLSQNLEALIWEFMTHFIKFITPPFS